MKLRIEKLELQVSKLERRFFSIIIILLIIALFGLKGAFSGILVGFSTLEVSVSMFDAIDPIIWFALIAGLGSGFRAYLGFLKVKAAGVLWNWRMFLTSFIPAVLAGLSSSVFLGMQLNLTSIILVFFGAAGFNSLQDKFGLQVKKK